MKLIQEKRGGRTFFRLSEEFDLTEMLKYFPAQITIFSMDYYDADWGLEGFSWFIKDGYLRCRRGDLEFWFDDSVRRWHEGTPE